MNANHHPSGMTVRLEPPGSVHFARILDAGGKVRGWLEIPAPVRNLDRALRAAARNLPALARLDPEVVELGWKRGRLTKLERRFLFSGVLAAVDQWEEKNGC